MEEEEAHEFLHTADHFAVDDLLVDFSNDDDEENDITVDSDGTNTATAVTDSSNSSSLSPAGLPNFQGDVQDGTSFSGELCVPVMLKINFSKYGINQKNIYFCLVNIGF